MKATSFLHIYVCVTLGPCIPLPTLLIALKPREEYDAEDISAMRVQGLEMKSCVFPVMSLFISFKQFWQSLLLNIICC